MSKDERVLTWIEERVDEFIDHVQDKYPGDQRVNDLLDKFSHVELLDADESQPRDGTWKNGKFKHSTGVLYVAPRDQHGTLRTPSSLMKTIVHELAHATRNKTPGETSHSQQWKQTWLWFLKIATQELGWQVDIKCAECTFYGLCDKSSCPKCTWLQELCRPYTGKPIA